MLECSAERRGGLRHGALYALQSERRRRNRAGRTWRRVVNTLPRCHSKIRPQCLQQLLALKYAITEMIILRKVRSNRRMAENIIFPLDYGWAQSEKNIP